jgi:hypothetical protein
MHPYRLGVGKAPGMLLQTLGAEKFSADQLVAYERRGSVLPPNPDQRGPARGSDAFGMLAVQADPTHDPGNPLGKN